MLTSVLEVSRHLIQAITALMTITEKFREVKYTYRKKELRILIKRITLMIRVSNRNNQDKKKCLRKG